MITTLQLIIISAVLAVATTGLIIAVKKDWIDLRDVATETRDRNPITRRHVAISIFALVGVSIPLAILYVSWTLAGPLSTVIYSVVFLLCFGLLPLSIGLMGKSIPMSMPIGKFHFILGQFAAGFGYLVQDKERYEMCIGNRERYWYNGEWHDVDEGLRNRTNLGWRPFTIVWHKTDDALEEFRVDGTAISDGGHHDVERAGLEEVAPPKNLGPFYCPGCQRVFEEERMKCPDCAEVLLQNTQNQGWIIDLKRLYRSGLQRVGSMDLIETTEEQTMRDEVMGSFTNEWSAVIGAIAGVIIGCVFGYLFLVGI